MGGMEGFILMAEMHRFHQVANASTLSLFTLW